MGKDNNSRLKWILLFLLGIAIGFFIDSILDNLF